MRVCVGERGRVCRDVCRKNFYLLACRARIVTVCLFALARRLVQAEVVFSFLWRTRNKARPKAWLAFRFSR